MAGDDITKMSDDEVRQFRIHHASMVYQDPGRCAESDDQGRPAGRRGVHDPRPGPEAGAGKRAQGPPAGPDRRSRRGSLSDIRTSSRAGCSSGSSSRSRWPPNPKLLVLDEPTTGLDATVEASVLDLVRSLQAETNAAVLLIAHNLGVIRTLCDRVGVMYAGKIVEEGDACARLRQPAAPVHAGPAAVAARGAASASRERALVDDPGQPAPDRDGPADLRVRRPLPAGRRAVPDGRAADRRRRRRPAGRAATTATGWPRSSSRRRSSARTPSTASRSLAVDQRLQDVPPERPRRAGPGQGQPRAVRRRDARAGRRVRVRQVDPRPDDPRHREPRRRRQHRARRARPGAPGRPSRPTDDKRSIQMVFQNPDSALNRGWTARHILAALGHAS